MSAPHPFRLVFAPLRLAEIASLSSTRRAVRCGIVGWAGLSFTLTATMFYAQTAHPGMGARDFASVLPCALPAVVLVTAVVAAVPATNAHNPSPPHAASGRVWLLAPLAWTPLAAILLIASVTARLRNVSIADTPWIILIGLGVATVTTARASASAYARVALRQRHCPACGYDRRATDHDAPCPECGHEPSIH